MFLKNREGETPPDCCSHNSKAWAALQANRKERDAKNIRLGRAEEKILHRLKLYHAFSGTDRAGIHFRNSCVKKHPGLWRGGHNGKWIEVDG